MNHFNASLRNIACLSLGTGGAVDRERAATRGDRRNDDKNTIVISARPATGASHRHRARGARNRRAIASHIPDPDTLIVRTGTTRGARLSRDGDSATQRGRDRAAAHVNTDIGGTAATGTATTRANNGNVAASRGGDAPRRGIVEHTIIIGASRPAAASSGHRHGTRRRRDEGRALHDVNTEVIRSRAGEVAACSVDNDIGATGSLDQRPPNQNAILGISCRRRGTGCAVDRQRTAARGDRAAVDIEPVIVSARPGTGASHGHRARGARDRGATP